MPLRHVRRSTCVYAHTPTTSATATVGCGPMPTAPLLPALEQLSTCLALFFPCPYP